MSELYPTQEEYQEMLNEIYARDPDLYDYIMYAEYDEPPEFDLDALEERFYLMGEYDDE